MEIFHGGCHGCAMQMQKGLGYCVGCQYFEANWQLPDLNDAHAAEEERINKVKDHARALAKKEGFGRRLINALK